MSNQSWAPQSPDLSGYAPQSPDLSAYKPSSIPAPTSNWGGPQSPDLSRPSTHNPQFEYPSGGFALDGHFDDRKPQSFDNLHHLAPHQSHHQTLQSSHQPPPNPGPQYGAPAPMLPTRGNKLKAEEADDDWAPQPSPAKPAGRGKKVKSEGVGATPPMQKMDTHGVEVKTKFPTARIKRIMQADEDVGKVAQVTPVVMAKALELFMIRLITSSAAVAKSRGSKRVLTTHMKAAVMQDEQFDNLREIVGKVPDAPVKGGAAADDDDDDAVEGSGKKRKKAATGGTKGRKRKTGDNDDS